MGGRIEEQQSDNGCLSYWLSNTVTLLYLLQRNIKPASGGAYNARLRSPGSRSAFLGSPGPGAAPHPGILFPGMRLGFSRAAVILCWYLSLVKIL
jgi:hypothetical protein